MEAMVMTSVGTPEVLRLQELAEPEIEHPEQVKIRILAAGINPVDTKIRSKGLFYDAAPPAILGCDGAGEVVATGDRVSRFRPGDRVWFCHGGLGREPGNYAQFTVVPETVLEASPHTIDWALAGAAPLVLITAWEALYDRGRLQEGQTVLIHAGAGGVGHVAIQLARIRGARVIATVGDNAKAAFARELGADHTVNYRTQDVVEQVNRLTDGHGVDLAFDTVGPEVFAQTIPAVAHYGTLVTILQPTEAGFAEARTRNLTIAFTLMLTPMLRDLAGPRAHHGEILRACADWIEQGQLKIHVSRSFPLSEAGAAHRLIGEGHVTGKLVLLPWQA